MVWWASKQRSWFLWWLPLMLQCFSCKNLPKCCYLFDKWLNLLWQPIQTQIEFRYFLLFHSCALLKFRQTFAWYIFDALIFFVCVHEKNVQVFTSGTVILKDLDWSRSWVKLINFLPCLLCEFCLLFLRMIYVKMFYFDANV